MDWKSAHVLVTGAAGFIGSHLVERLTSEGAMVKAFVRYNSRNDIGMLRFLPEHIKSEINIFRGDLRDADALQNAMRGVDMVFHLAALIAIPYSYDHPREVAENNILGTLNILMAAREFKTRRIIHTSTSEVYGTARYVPIDELHPLQGQSPYSASKIGADKLVESFNRSFDLPTVIVRPFNTYGPRQSSRAVIPDIISQALFGNEVRLGNLEPSRDFTYVLDTVDGFLRAAPAEKLIGSECNLGNDQTIRIGELAEKIIAMTGRKIEIVYDPKRDRPKQSEVMKLWASNQKALELMGWQPTIPLEKGLRLTMDWIAANGGFYEPGKFVS